MFKNLVDLWLQYIARIGQAWAPDDPRRELGLEVVERFFQLDIVLEYLNRALTIFSGDSILARRKDEFITQAFPELRTGEMTKEKFKKLTDIQWALDVNFPDHQRGNVRASEEIRLFTEAFYFFAWRLVEILTSRAFPFDGLSKLKVKGIRIVRNHLLQHPEKHGQNFRQSFSITSNGPIMKTVGPVIRLLPDKIETEYEGPDRGLFVNAQELYDEIKERIRKSLGLDNPIKVYAEDFRGTGDRSTTQVCYTSTHIMADTRLTPIGLGRKIVLCLQALFVPGRLATAELKDEEIRKSFPPASNRPHRA